MTEGTPEEQKLELDERLVQLAAAASHNANRWEISRSRVENVRLNGSENRC
jgi:hypothetical protein